MNTFISKEETIGKLNNEKVRIVDCRFQLGNPDMGQEQYKKGHIPGSVYFHLEQDLSGVISEHGGRHPLPKIEEFKRVLDEAGITNETTVIAYDGGEGAYASRLWWLLKYVGHEKVYIVDGGFKEWEASKYPIDCLVPEFPLSSYRIHIQDEMLVSVNEVKEAIHDEGTILIDSRERKRYLGIEEPIDKKAGHIPTAINKVWTEGFNNGIFKTFNEQEERFKDLKKDQHVIVYCGSGITATPNYIALKDAGFLNVKLYAGSFSDWITYEENEVVKGE